MTKKERELLIEIISLITLEIDKNKTTIAILQKEIKLLNKKINILRGGKHVRN